MSHRRTTLFIRLGAAIGAVLAAWVAVDTLVSNVITAGAAGGAEFFMFWGVPFVAASVFLGWYAVRGGHPEARELAPAGCLGGSMAGGFVFLALLLTPLVLPWDMLRGAVAAVQYAPLAATLGLGLGIIARRIRQRRA
jgi:hypothetical protein